tara:strand:+ start:81 stop:248 length:168 start_codon:yes stop_codon:yes gene_type:complete
MAGRNFNDYFLMRVISSIIKAPLSKVKFPSGKNVGNEALIVKESKQVILCPRMKT